MSTLMIIANAIILGVLLCIAGIIIGVLGSRRVSRRVPAEWIVSGDQMPSNPKLQTVPAVNIENASSVGQPGATARTSAADVGKRPRRDEHGRLVFIQEGRVRFEIEDLLRASAEVLGSGNFGSSYKATLCEGPAVVVKRFKDMNGVGREDFSEHMRSLGALVASPTPTSSRSSPTSTRRRSSSSPTTWSMVASPSSSMVNNKQKSKSLLPAYDDLVKPSINRCIYSSGNRGSIMDWGKRLRIIKGAARGLAHLYDELSMLTVPHGHLKLSNVLLDGAFEAMLSDYALVPVVTSQIAAQVMVAYKSPKCTVPHGKPSKKSDVWSLGILILEVLTGKFSVNNLGKGRQNTDLAGWVHSVISEEHTREVFDKDITGAKGAEADMVKLLQVGLGCWRWGLKTVIARIDEIPMPSSTSLVSTGPNHTRVIYQANHH
jgi:serine/threonine protein kinase